jgi:hypothetical protein
MIPRGPGLARRNFKMNACMCQSTRCTQHELGACAASPKSSGYCAECEEARFADDAEKARAERERKENERHDPNYRPK